MNPVERVLEGLNHVKRSGDGWVARCPAHEDRQPSLSIGEGDDGRVLLHCHAGCTSSAIVAALGLNERDLFAETHEPSERRAAATYDYVDEQGQLVSQVVRFEPKGFRQRRPDGSGGWLWNLRGTRRVLYRLPALLETQGRIFVVEGERDVHSLERLGLVATTNAMGAGKWLDEYAEQLNGVREACVIPDADDTGRKHAQQVASSLARAGVSVRLVDLWPQHDDGRDVSDWLRTGMNGGGGERHEQALSLLLDIAERTPQYLPDAELELEPTKGDSQAWHIVTAQDFAAVDEPGAAALVGTDDEALIPERGDVMVYGDGGVGKTTLCIDLALHLAAGDDWLGFRVGRAVRVLMVENEGPRPRLRKKLRRKLDGWTGSPIGDRLLVFEEPWKRVTFADETSRVELAEQIRAHEVDVVIVGPVTRAGMNEAGTLQDVRAFADLVDEVRERSGRAVVFVLVHHENKGGKVSGAWEGSGDTLLHVQGQGNGRTRLYVQKARWSSAYHDTGLQLRWTEAQGFEVDEVQQRDEQQIADDLLAAVLASGGGPWKPIEESVAGRGETLRAIRDRLIDGGTLINTGSGTRMELWHVDDPARPATLDAERVPVGTRSGHGFVSGSGEAQNASVSPCPDSKRDTGTRDAFASPVENAAGVASTDNEAE